MTPFVSGIFTHAIGAVLGEMLSSEELQAFDGQLKVTLEGSLQKLAEDLTDEEAQILRELAEGTVRTARHFVNSSQ